MRFADTIFLLRRQPAEANFERLVRWCNGSTRVFGALCHGSNPCRTASFPGENEEVGPHCKPTANPDGQVKYPVKIRAGGKVRARIYNKRKGFPYYRLVWRANGEGYRLRWTEGGKVRVKTFDRQGGGRADQTHPPTRSRCTGPGPEATDQDAASAPIMKPGRRGIRKPGNCPRVYRT